MSIKKQHIHLIGIGGSGMTALANLLLEKGYYISGSDKKDFSAKKKLEQKGIKIFIGHQIENIQKPKIVVYSSAIPKNNIELLQAKKKKIPVFNRFDYLIKLLNNKKIISIAGSHGKSTTVAMTAHILKKQGLKPIVYLGAKTKDYPLGSEWTNGEYAIIETDEHDKSFLKTPSYLPLITNVDNDHLFAQGPYKTDFSLLKKAFQIFAEQSLSGFIVLNNDDEFLKTLCKKTKKQIINFGINKKTDLSVKNIQYLKNKSTADLYFQGKFEEKLHLVVPEKENIYNALGAILIAKIIGIPFKDSLKHIKTFSGVERRFSVVYNQKIAIVDDYAHHPTEIKSLLRMAHQVFGKRRIILILEPHRYSRISFLYKEYALAVKNCNVLFLLPIDPANEKPIKGIDEKIIYEQILKQKTLKKTQIHLNNDSSELFKNLYGILKKNDVVIFTGPGKIANLPYQFINFLKKNEK